MAKKIVMHVNFTMNIGGIESFIMNVVRNLDRTKIEPIILTYSSSKFDHEVELKSLGVQVLRISKPADVTLLTHVKELIDVFGRNHVDVVHAHTYFDSVFVALAALLSGVRVRIVHSHTALAHTEKRFYKKVKWMAGRIFLKLLATDRLACSNEAGTALFGGKSSYTILPNGIDLNKFRYESKSRARIRKELTIPTDARVVGHVGRLDVPKNHTYLLDIFYEYLKNDSSARLVCVGSGILASVIKEKIRNLGLEDSVLMLGDRSDIHEILSAMDVFIFPSIYEGLPVSLIEAQANGIPIVMSSAVSREVIVTNDVMSVELSESPALWARVAGDQSRGVSTGVDSRLAEFSVIKTVRLLETFYMRDDGE